MTAGIHINWASNKYLRKRILRCPTDECRTEFVVRFEAWHGCTWMCCRCGDAWVDEGMRPRPLERDWRRKQVACHRSLWDIATHGPDPTERELYPDYGHRVEVSS